MSSAQAKRVVLFGINYWPEEIGIAPYTTGLAEHLADSGWETTVVTGLPHYPHWQVPTDFRKRGMERGRRNGVEIVRLWHHVPRQQTALRRGGYEITYCLNGLRKLNLRRPDLSVGVVPSLGGGVLTALAAKRWRIPSAVVVQDLMANAAKQSGIPGGGRVARATGKVEAWVGRTADAMLIVSESFRATALGFGVPAEKIVHLPNWTRLPAPSRPRAETRAALGWRDGEFVVLHAGNMGLKQALENVIATAKLAAGDAAIRFVLMGGGSQRPVLEAAAAGLASVTFKEPCATEELPEILAAADALLVNERASVIDMSLPSKLTSYFAAGRPVIGAVPEGSTAAEIRRAGAGLVVPAEQPDALLRAVRRLREDTALAERLGRAGPDYAASALGKTTILQRAEGVLTGLVSGHATTAQGHVLRSQA